MGYRKVWVETDPMETMNLIRNGHMQEHRDSGLLDEVKSLMEMDWEIRIIYAPRSANYAADYLAKQGLGTRHGLVEVYQHGQVHLLANFRELLWAF